MNNRGKTITLFLMDGSATGCIRYTLANWTGVAYKIPRTKLDYCLGRSDLKRSGVYFLFGTSDDTGKNVVYIGQAGARKKGGGYSLVYRNTYITQTKITGQKLLHLQRRMTLSERLRSAILKIDSGIWQ